ncbi:cyclophane-forming radical SAM/SPASM peptide maturase YhhB [Insolitispirillum peregrinum]|uniref:cyclophane-forming radical SAM/SPASM peptide maturase YhhB n=1 Tax=Insolitispirillum peregrinum TaxID=80876 RepID=UPI00361696BA
MTSPIITSFLVKVASRCNLDCDYCYIYHHADKSWRKMPHLMSDETQDTFVQRLAEYVEFAKLSRCAVIFHGGEPLLAGADNLAKFAHKIRAATTAQVDIGLQTNGLLLDQAALDILEIANVGVSLSLDGPRSANDRHRTTRRGRSSFDKVFAALEHLKRRPQVFAGVIAVIDPATTPEEVFSFFSEHNPPQVDFLLPDAQHIKPPPGRDANPDSYKSWLLQAFDVWLDKYPHLPVRTFEALLDSVSGLPSRTDAFGFGDVSLLSIETDGSYHDLDVLKVTHDGATSLGVAISDTPISVAVQSPIIDRHQKLLRKDGLCDQCQACSIVDICGGGSLPHRFSQDGFSHPTVYCGEMLALVSHVRHRLYGLLFPVATTTAAPAADIDFECFEKAETAREAMAGLIMDADATARRGFLAALDLVDEVDAQRTSVVDVIRSLPEKDLTKIARRPGTIAWTQTYLAQRAGRLFQAVDGSALYADATYLDEILSQKSEDYVGYQVAERDTWLRAPFGKAIIFESEELAMQARPLASKALTIIDNWRPLLAAEMSRACGAIQFIRDPLAHPDKIVSFSDNSVPGALYVSVVRGAGLIDAYDLADSLIHEHRHQKLYLLERQAPMVHPTTRLVPSPWRADPRPPSGLLHAVFVFVELQRFWAHVRDWGPARMHNRAVNQLHDTELRLAQAFSTLRDCPLTMAGKRLVEVLANACQGVSSNCLIAHS